MKKRALVLGVGGLRGAFAAGVTATLCKELGPEYFDAIYASSVGVYAATFYVANQPDTIENTWRNLVSGRQLVNYLNPLRGRAILDLEYLSEIFQNGKSTLNVKAVLSSPVSLFYVITNAVSLTPEYIRPNREEIFRMMEASCAAPPFHNPIQLNNGLIYVDGSLSDPLPFERALQDGHDEVIVITNKQRGFYVDSRFGLYVNFARTFPLSGFSRVISRYETDAQKIEEAMEADKRIKVIRPKEIRLRSIVDTNKRRLNQTIDHGVEEAHRFMSHL